VIDAERVVTAIHQDHDYSNVEGGRDFVWTGPEAVANQRLVGGDRYVFSLGDSTHVLTAEGLRPARALPYLWRRLYTAPLLHRRLGFLRLPLSMLLGLTRRIRGKTGLTMSGLAQRSQ
jgi:hypothetical protein